MSGSSASAQRCPLAEGNFIENSSGYDSSQNASSDLSPRAGDDFKQCRHHTCHHASCDRVLGVVMLDAVANQRNSRASSTESRLGHRTFLLHLLYLFGACHKFFSTVVCFLLLSTGNFMVLLNPTNYLIRKQARRLGKGIRGQCPKIFT